MWFLRQSTASQEIPLGPFVDSTDGNTQETALTIANTDIKLFKAGATSEASKNSGGATHIASGRYYAVLDATDTDTIGPLRVLVHVSGALAVWLDCCVLDEAVYDVLFGTTAPSTYAGADTSGTTTLLSRVVGTLASGTHNPQSGDAYAYLGTNLGALGANATEAGGTGDQFTALALSAAGVDALWDEASGAHTTTDTMGGLLYEMRKSLVSVLGTVNDAGATATEFDTDLTQADNWWNDALIVFYTGNLAGVARPISDFTNTGGHITLDEALPAAPDNGSNFTVIATHIHPISQIQSGLATTANVSAVETDTQDIQSRLPAALVSGRMDSNVQATAAALTFDLTGSITGNLSGSVGSVAGAVGSVTGNVGGNVTGSIGSLATQAKADVNAECDTALADAKAEYAAAIEAAILDEGDATALLAAIAAKVEEFLINDGDTSATLAAIATAVRTNLATELGRIDAAVTSRAPSATALSTAQWTNTLATNLGTLAGHDPGSTLAAASDVSALQTHGDSEWATADVSALALEASVQAVKNQTDNLPSDPADQSLVIAATDAIISRLGTPAATVSADIAAVKSDTAAIKTKTDNLPNSPAAVGSQMNLADNAITEAKISTPAEAAGRPTGILGMICRIFEKMPGGNKQTRDRSTGTVTLRNAADSGNLETHTQSTSGDVDTQTKGA